MDLAMGGMVSLLPKLSQLLQEEYKLQKSAEQDVISLRTELQRMQVALAKVAAKPRDKVDDQDLLWASEVRELSHEIEDLVENFLVSAEGSVPHPDDGCFKVLAARMAGLFKMARARRDVATAMEAIKGKAHEVAAREVMYRTLGGEATPGAAAQDTWTPGTGTIPNIDPKLSVLFEKQTTIGMDDVRDVIINKLREADHVSKELPKTLSIVGFGGLGKTTLAKAVYDKLHGEFDGAAFVTVSRQPDMRNIFKSLLYYLDKEKFESLKLSNLDKVQLMHELRQSLQTETDGKRKRYFLVIDDIWTIQAWTEISYVFMDTNCGSRVITTTRNVSVASECCSSDDDIHKMKPLSEGDSQRLFYKRIFGNETGCPSHLEQVSRDILKKCDGVPLAIITLASHLASNHQTKTIDKWHILLESIGRGLSNDGSLKNMKDILLFSYYDLPPLLKTCLLYLSIFPGGYRIDKGRLIRRWIAEGFLQGHNDELGLFAVGELCFNELVNRSLIQPIDIDIDGRAQACRVHDMMLDVICDLSRKKNFVTILDVTKEDIPVHIKVRRLSAQKQTDELGSTRLATMMISQVRSFTIFSVADNQVLPLSRFRVLRVLDLEVCDLYTSSSNFKGVVNLLHLRYLGLGHTGLDEIPEGIGKLLLLQILDLSGSGVRDLPASVARLRNLICLYLGKHTALPKGFWKLTSLEELTRVRFREDGVELQVLRHLIKLRVLQFSWPKSFGADELAVLVESLGKLGKLESLEVYTARKTSMDAMQGWVPTPHIRRLELQGWFQTLPTWISSSSLPLLSFLYVVVREVRPEDIENLGDLPSLRYLKLRSILSYGDTAIQRFMLRPDAFPCLRECEFKHFILEPSAFTQGAMPIVQELRFCLATSDILGAGDSLDILSIRNLPSLKQVQITLHSDNSTMGRYSEAVAALRRVTAYHPNPRLQLDVRPDNIPRALLDLLVALQRNLLVV